MTSVWHQPVTVVHDKAVQALHVDAAGDVGVGGVVGKPDHGSIAGETSPALTRLCLWNLLLLCKLRQARVQDSALVSRQDIRQNVTQTGVGPAPAVVIAHETGGGVVGGPDEDA